MLFQPGAKPFAAAHGRKNSGACFLYNLPVYKAMAAVLSARGQPGNLGQATA